MIEARDHRHHVKFAYTPMGSLKLREQNGTKIHFQYNKQEELTGIVNERSERYLFARNGDGQVIRETGFDGLTRIYHRSRAGKVLKVERPENRWTEYEYDQAGRIVRAEYSDGSWETYSYNKNGQLTEARNEQTVLELKRDVLGRVIGETQDGYQVKSQYDKMGNRTRVSSSLGAAIDLEWNEYGRLSTHTARQGETTAWQAKMQYNSLGLEIERVMNGELVSNWQYDSAGRPLEHTVGKYSTATTKHKKWQRHKRYHWGVNDTLKNIQCMLSGQVQSFDYDVFGNLVACFSLCLMNSFSGSSR